jgi:hypothetical protein
LLITLVLVVAVTGVHRWGKYSVLAATLGQDSGWLSFQQRYAVAEFGQDGYFVRAVKNGYNLFFHTERYGWRFTRKTAADPIHSCAGCHTPEDMAYSFVSADRYDLALGQRVSFEQRLMRCYASPSRMNGFVPTLYDPAIRDLRIFARMVAHSLQLSEGYLSEGSLDDGYLDQGEIDPAPVSGAS